MCDFSMKLQLILVYTIFYYLSVIFLKNISKNEVFSKMVYPKAKEKKCRQIKKK